MHGSPKQLNPTLMDFKVLENDIYDKRNSVRAKIGYKKKQVEGSGSVRAGFMCMCISTLYLYE